MTHGPDAERDESTERTDHQATECEGRQTTECEGRQATECEARIEFVRPFAYVEPHPVVRQVGDRELYVGNVHAAQPDATDHAFAHVLTLTEDAQPLTTHHHGFADSADHDYRAFAAAVDDLVALRDADGATLVHCKAGVSRSASVLATALAATEDRSFHDALVDVERARPAATPNPDLVESAIVYLAARD